MKKLLIFSLVGCYQPSIYEPQVVNPTQEISCAVVDVVEYVHNIANFDANAIDCIDVVNSGDVGQVVDFMTLDASAITTCDEAGVCETPYSCANIEASLVIEDLQTSEISEVEAGSSIGGCAFREMPVQPGRELRVFGVAENAAAEEGFRVAIFVR